MYCFLIGEIDIYFFLTSGAIFNFSCEFSIPLFYSHSSWVFDSFLLYFFFIFKSSLHMREISCFLWYRFSMILAENISPNFSCLLILTIISFLFCHALKNYYGFLNIICYKVYISHVLYFHLELMLFLNLLFCFILFLWFVYSYTSTMLLSL